MRRLAGSIIEMKSKVCVSLLEKIYLLRVLVKERPALIYSLLLAFGAISAYFLIKDASQSSYHVPEEYAYVHKWFNVAVMAINGEDVIKPLMHQPAYYLYLAYIMKFLNIAEPLDLFYGVQYVMGGLFIAACPIIIYKLTNSLSAAVPSPFVAHFLFKDMLFVDITSTGWILGWVVVMGVPIAAVLFSERWSRTSWYWYAAACLTVAAGNTVRAQASLPITVLLLILLFVKLFVKPKKEDGIRIFLKCNVSFFIALMALLVSQSLLSSTIPNVIHPSYMDDSNTTVKSSSGIWHTLYLGFGWEDNKYGIEWRDGYGRELAEKINPGVAYHSYEYFDILKTEYLHLLKSDPGFFFSSYFRKFVTATLRVGYHCHRLMTSNLAFDSILVLFALLCVYINKHKKTFGLSLLLCSIFSVFSAMIVPLMSVPWDYYIYGSNAAGGLILLSLCIAVIIFIVNAVKHEFKSLCPAVGHHN